MLAPLRRHGRRVARAGSGAIRRLPPLARPSPRVARALGATGWLLLACAQAPPRAEAAREIELGFAEPRFTGYVDPANRAAWFDRAADAGAQWARLGVGWRGLAHRRPADETDPADPAYNFWALDGPVRDAAARGMKTMLTVTFAPDWAEGPNRPVDPEAAPPGTWRPSPAALGRFAEALAARYDGSFPDPLHPGEALPRVRHFEVWNEPNLRTHLTPQRSASGRPVSPEIYRGMLNAFYAGAQRAQPRAVVIAGANSPFGDDEGPRRVRPLDFLDQLLCLEPRSHRPLPCRQPARFDRLSHHPIDTAQPPSAPALERGDASMVELTEIREMLRIAEAAGNVAPAGKRRRVWVTEFWWQSSPPQANARYPDLATQAEWLEQGLRVLWRQRIRVAIYFQAGDSNPGERWTTGVYTATGRPKPALEAFETPLLVRSRSSCRASIWTRSPVAGRLDLRVRRRGRWRTLESRLVGAGEVVVIRRAAIPAGRVLRVRNGDRRSSRERVPSPPDGEALDPADRPRSRRTRAGEEWQATKLACPRSPRSR